MGKKFLILGSVFLVLFLAGCGAFDKAGASLTGYSKKCIEGVVYYQFSSGATVAYNPDGTIKTCK